MENIMELPLAAKVQEVGIIGHWTLIVVFLIFLASSVAMAVLAYRRPDNALFTDRAHHYVTFKIVAIATISYYAMAGGYGAVNLLVNTEGPVYRKFFYARYIDWLFTTPLLLTDLLLFADMTYHHTTRILFFDVLMILTGLFGALTHGLYKWGWWVIGCIFMLVIFYDLIVVTRSKVLARSESIAKLFTSLGGLLLILWTLYPVVWALGEGWQIISVDIEILLYGILDILAKVAFGWILLLGVGKISIGQESAALSGDNVEGGTYSSLNTNA